MWLDRTFRYQVLRDVLADRSRRLAPSYGFDLGPVLTHARRAWLLDTAQHLVTVGVLLLALWRSPRGVGLAAVLAYDIFIAGTGSLLARESTRQSLRGGDYKEVERLRSLWQWWRIGMVVALLATVGCLILLQAPLPFRHPGTAAATRLAFTSVLWVAGWTLVAVAGVPVLAAQARQAAIDGLQAGAERPAPSRSRRMQDLAEDQHNKATVYSRPYPFVGSGVHVSTWSFALRLVRSAKDGKPPQEFDRMAFRTLDLVNWLREMIGRLTKEPDREFKLPGLTVEDRIFVEGKKALDVPELLAQADFHTVLADPSRPERHYLACQVVSWEGELVTTVYVHASLQGRTLYLDFSSWVVPPTLKVYRVADKRDGVGLAGHLTAFGASLRHLPGAIASVGPWCTASLQIGYRRYLGPRDSYEARWRHRDVGAVVSTRELGAGMATVGNATSAADTEIEYFQARDVVKHVKVVEQRLLQSVLDFLEEKDVDTSEYRQRMTAILNNGVVMNLGSGNVSFAGSALGQNATVVNTGTAGDTTPSETI